MRRRKRRNSASACLECTFLLFQSAYYTRGEWEFLGVHYETFFLSEQRVSRVSPSLRLRGFFYFLVIAESEEMDDLDEKTTDGLGIGLIVKKEGRKGKGREEKNNQHTHTLADRSVISCVAF